MKVTMPILDHFGFLAPFYDRLIKPKVPETLWNFLQLPTDGLLLDAGGGTGRMAQFMLEKSAGVVLADLSAEMLMEAQEKGEFLRVCSHTESFPFPDGVFSRILMVDALHHVCDQPQTAIELWRVLKNDGYLVIEEPDLRTVAVKLVAIAEKLALMRSHFLAPPDIAALFDFPQADVRIETEPDGFNAWVIVQKSAN
jgi:demethylmenaquinone methyltransferase/2-methoxy-6-polyprenyl-1,4-benzoquinol methylase